MSTKKFKSDVQLEQNITLPNKTAQRALIINASNQLVESAVTETELARLSGLTSDIIEANDVGVANGVAGLDANGKVPTGQLPALSFTEVFNVADIAARDALTIGSADGEVQEGDVVVVTDASADANITSGAASYIYDGAAYVLLKAGDEVLSVNGQTGIVVLTTDDVSEGANLYFTDERAQDAIAAALTDTSSITFTYNDVANTIEANIDITSNTALSSADASDELLIYDVDATEVKKITKSNLLAGSGNVSDGDILETSATLLDNQSTAQDVTGLSFANATVRSFKAQISIVRGATYETYELMGVQKGSSWDMSQEAVGDDTGITFSITAAGQVQYTSTNTGSGAACRFRADTTKRLGAS